MGARRGANDSLPALHIPPRNLLYNYEKYAPLLPELAESAHRAREFSPLLADLARAAAAGGDAAVMGSTAPGKGAAGSAASGSAAPPSSASRWSKRRLSLLFSSWEGCGVGLR